MGNKQPKHDPASEIIISRQEPEKNITVEGASYSVKLDENGFEIGAFLPSEIVATILSYLENEPLGIFSFICKNKLVAD